MVTSAFDVDSYTYPDLHKEVRGKIKQLQQSIKKLEANLIDADTDDDGVSKIAQRLAKQDLAIDYASELNPNQLLATTTIDGKILVIAGAGSGKTKTLTYRTSYLLENGVAPSSILLLTFTRKAANEIKGRARALLSATLDDSQRLNNITSGTFHSFCNMLLRKYSGLLGIHTNFTILDTIDSEDALDLLIKDKKYPIDKSKQAFPRKKTLQKLISTSRNRRILLRNLIEDNYPDLAMHIPIIEQLAEDYHTFKRSNHLYDFDDIIGQVVYHLRQNRRFREILQQTYRHVMVDEYQDTNVPQKQLIDLICEPDSVSLMVVGDDNQSIYAFRGANYENILLFGETYPDAKLIKLEQNYRSSPAILDYVNALSEQITLGYQKRLFSDVSVEGFKPIFCRRTDERAEASYIADTIISLKDDQDYKDFAVLCRTSFQSNYIQVEFMERGIPFIVVGGIKFIERRHIKDILAFIKVLFNPNDTISWHRILTLLQGIGDVTAVRLTKAIHDNNNSFAPLKDPKLGKKSEQLTPLHDALEAASKASNVEAVLDKLLEFYVPVMKLLEENWRERTEDFRVLKNLAKEYDSIERFLENLALDPPNDSVATLDKPKDENDDAVTISTIHSAKGLEWPIVFINCLLDGMTPHHRSIDDFEAVEEERKLFYVACSRAKTRLYMTAPDYLASFSGYFDQASRFIAEVPEDTLTIYESPRKPRNTLLNRQPDEPEWW